MGGFSKGEKGKKDVGWRKKAEESNREGREKKQAIRTTVVYSGDYLLFESLTGNE